MFRRLFLATITLTISLGLATETFSQEITFGDSGLIRLLPNTAGQEVQLFIADIPGVNSAGFAFQVGDGGSAVGGSLQAGEAPSIAGADFITNTIFAGGDFAQQNNPASEEFAFLATVNLVDPGSVAVVDGNGLLGTITFDTTSVSSGNFEFALIATPDGQPQIPTEIGTLDTGTGTSTPVPGLSLQSGSIVIAAVPEPSSALLISAFGGFLLSRRRRKS